jgi:hypothetical protein
LHVDENLIAVLTPSKDLRDRYNIRQQASNGPKTLALGDCDLAAVFDQQIQRRKPYWTRTTQVARAGVNQFAAARTSAGEGKAQGAPFV